MALSRATRRKLILLAAGVALFALIGLLYVAREARLARGLERDLASGMAAYEEGQYEEAIQPLSRYVGRRRENPEVLLAFADARRQVPAEDGTNSHLRHSLGVTRLALDLDPGSAKGRRMLMEITAQMGFFTEADEAADSVLEIDPGDFDAYYVKLAAARATGRDGDLASIAHRLADARPEDFTAQMVALEHIIETEPPLEDVRTHVAESSAAFEGGMAAELLQARAAAYGMSAAPTPDEQADCAGELAARLRAAAALRPASAEEAVAYFQFLDTQPALSLEVSADEVLMGYLADPELGPGLRSFAIARAWQRDNGRMIEEIAAGYEDLSTLDDQTLGWLTISLPEQDRFRDELAKRAGDFAHAWRTIVEAVDLARTQKFVDARQAVAPLIAAGAIGTAPVAKYIDAMSLQALGEDSLAEQHLSELAAEPTWVRARTALRELAWRRGDFETAYELLGRDNLPGTALLHLEAAVYLDEADYNWPAGRPNGRQLADRALLNLPEDPVIRSLHGRAELAAGNTARALDVADELAQMEASGGNEYVLRFAERLASIDPERAAMLRERFAVAVTDPLQAVVERVQGTDISAQELRPMIEEAIEGAAPDVQLRGRLLLAGVLDEIGDASAAEEFARLSAEHAGDAQVQIAALNSRMIWQDLDAVEPVIGRLRSLIGEDGITWRVHQYKLDLLRDESEAAAARVVNGLSSVLRLAPSDVLALQLMTEAMRRVGDVDRAAGYAIRASDAAPDSLRLALDAVETLVSAERMEEASARLRASAAKPDQSITNRTRRAMLLSRFGFTAEAQHDWLWLASVDHPESRARAAGVLALVGRTDEASSAVAELLVLESLDPLARELTADALANLGRLDEGLALLERMEESPGVDRAATIAEYLSRHASTPEEVSRLEQFVRASDSADAWAALIRRYMGEGRIDEARLVLADARERVRNPAGLASFDRALDPEMELDPNSFLAVAQANLTTVDAEWSRELSDRLELAISGEETLAQFADYLRGFVRSRPSVMLGWMLLSQAEATLGDRAAVRLTTQSMMEAIPADPGPARYAMNLFRRLRMPEEGLLAAREYAERLDSPTAESARSVAEFAMATNRPDEAWQAISLWKDRLGDNAGLSLYARAALATGHTSEAEAVVWPRTESDVEWLHEAIQVAEAIPDGAQRRRWLERAAGTLAPDDERGRFLLANGWYQLALDRGDADALNKALGLAQADAADPAIEASLSLLEGSCLSQLGRGDEAIVAYRKALELRPEEPDALNNLAYLLIERDGSAEEALGYAQRAVNVLRARAASQDTLVEYLDTLGTALLRAGRPQEALEAFDEALRARPTYDYALVGLAETLAALDRPEEARQALAKVGGSPSVALAERVHRLQSSLD